MDTRPTARLLRLIPLALIPIMLLSACGGPGVSKERYRGLPPGLEREPSVSLETQAIINDDGDLALVTYGSSSNPPTVVGVEAPAADEVEIVLEQKTEGPMTADMAPTTHIIPVPESATDRPLSVHLIWEDSDREVHLTASADHAPSSPEVGGGTADSGSSAIAAPSYSISVEADPTDYEPRHDLSHESVVDWTRYEVLDDSTLRVHVTTGDPKCNGLRYVLEENSQTVSIATIHGVPPNAPEQCTAVAALLTLRVPLAEPLGDRTVEPLEVEPAELTP